MDLDVVFISGTDLVPQRFPDVDGTPVVRNPYDSPNANFADFKYSRGRKAAAINLDHVAYMTFDLNA